MVAPSKVSIPEGSMSVMDAIHRRRAVRHYAPQQIDPSTIRTLLDAAVHAPTALHEEPWAFAVIQDRNLLERLSDSVKEGARRSDPDSQSETDRHLARLLSQADFHVFHDAGTLIVIYSKFSGPFVVADCWLAAENLMLAACALGLGTCVIGSAVAALNMPIWKTELKIPATMTAVAPIIAGIPGGEPPAVSRKPAEIVAWR